MRSIVFVAALFSGCDDVSNSTSISRKVSKPLGDGDPAKPQDDVAVGFSARDISQGCQQYFARGQHAGGQVRPRPEPACFGQIPGDAAGNVAAVNVVFIRHAQSEWNKAYEEAHRRFLPRDPHLLDAHLSDLGIDQSCALANAIESGSLAHLSEDDKSILRGQQVGGRRSIFASSNLRRATLTLLIAFRRIFLNPTPGGPRIHVLSSLQERGSIDAQSLTSIGEKPYLTLKDRCPFKEDKLKDVFETSCNDGNEMRRRIDLQANTCTWIRRRALEGVTDFVLVGHSNWLGSFFQAFSANGQDASDPAHLLAAHTKLSNAGMIKFRFSTGPLGDCRIVPGTTVVANGDIKYGN